MLNTSASSIDPIVVPVAEKLGDLADDLRGNILPIDRSALRLLFGRDGDVANLVLPPADRGLLVI